MHVITAPRLEPLLEHLAGVIREKPLDPFEHETIIVAQNVGLRVWLEQALARELGVAAGLNMPAPPVFSTALSRALVRGATPSDGPDGAQTRHPFDEDVMMWRLRSILADLPIIDETGRLRYYLHTAGEGPAPLSRIVAALFADYQLYRPDVLAAWQSGEFLLDGWPDEPWQAYLWRELHMGLDSETLDRAESLTELIAVLDGVEDVDELGARLEKSRNHPMALPKRITVFGALLFPPVHLRVLEALDRLVPVTMYTPATGLPANAYDLAANGYRHPLLRSLAERTRDWVHVLADVGHPPVEALAAADPVGEASVLHKLQAALHADAAPTGDAVLDPADRSIRILNTHGPVRELEVLRDHLLGAFDTLPGLRPSDIIVIVPDPAVYAPLIDAVFGAETIAGTRLPYHVVEHPFSPATRLFESVFAAMRLLDGRVTSSEVLALLGSPAIRNRAGIRDDELPTIRTWVGESGIRWGLDGAHKRAFDLPEDDLHTWRFGLERMLLAYAAGDEAWVLDRATTDVAGMDGADLLGRFASWFATLTDEIQLLTTDRGRADWPEAVMRFLDRLLLPSDETDQTAVRFLRSQAQSLASVFAVLEGDAPVEFADVRAHLEASVGSFEPREPYLAGGITFVRPLPLRFAPHRVVAFLGLNDGVYPYLDEPAGFDLLAHEPQAGDPTPRRSAKQLFLDALLAARDRLILAYAGRSQQDNHERPASIVLDAFCDTLDRTFGDGAADSLTEIHPLQPFDSAYFRGDTPLFSYADQHRIEPVERRVDTKPFIHPGDLPAEPDVTQISIADMARAWTSPSHRLTNHLRIRLNLDESALSDDEPVEPEGLDRWGVRQALLNGIIDGEDEATLHARIRQGGLLPAGAPGQSYLQEARESIQELVDRVRHFGETRAVSLNVNVRLPGRSVALTGSIKAVSSAGAIRYSASTIREKQIVTGWIDHLALSAAVDAGHLYLGGRPRTILLGRDGGAHHFAALPEGEAEVILGILARGYERLRSEPVPVFPMAAKAYASAVSPSARKDFAAALILREKSLLGDVDGERPVCQHEPLPHAIKKAKDGFAGGFKALVWDEQDPPISLITRGRDVFAEGAVQAELARWSMILWAPILDSLQDGVPG